ncbi:MAG: glycosyltransferase [Paludibacteraceae bacterium]|nr:glycosyltransferase [Paludibacteraceae bacterium]
MKILQIITKCELGGAQAVMANLANCLVGNHEMYVASGEGDGKMWELFHPDVKRIHLKHLQRSVNLKEDFLALREIRKLYKQIMPDVVHLHASKVAILGKLTIPREKIIYTVHGFDSIRVANRIFLPITRLTQRLCASTVGVSKYDYDNLVSERITHNIEVIYNGISHPDTSSMEDIPLFHQYDKTILAIARLAPPKEPRLFVEIAKRLPQYGFIWIGNNEEVGYDDIPENCHFIGNICNAGAYCSVADLFCLTSGFEGLPISILEAMSFGKPVVASKVGGIPEIVEDGENGYTVENDADIFAKRIKEILEDSSLYEKMCQKSLDIFNEKLTYQTMVDKYLAIYNRIYNQNN